MLPDVERRVRPLAATDFTLRAAPDDADPVFTGHAAVFNVRTAIGNPLTWGFYEEIAPGAFTKTLKEGDPRFLVDHDTALLVARVSAGDLRLAEDDLGLATEAELDQEVSYVRDLTVNVRKRRITGMSFGFEVVKDEWTTIDAGTLDNGDTVEAELRTIREVKLYEVSAVTFPAYEETDAALRAVRCRTNPDPLGRRAALLQPEETAREPAPATRGDEDAEPAVSTRLTVAHVDLAMRGYAARYGLPL